MKVREIAYSNRFLGDYKPFTQELITEAITDLLQIAESIESEMDVEDLRKGVYQDNYHQEVNGNKYVLQHDIVCDYLVLYEVLED